MITPLFASHYSMDSLLTLEEPGKAKPGAPVSVYDLALEAGLKDVVLVDSRIGGFIQAYKAADKAKVKLCYGIKMVVAADAANKEDESRYTESKIIIFLKETAGYSDLIRIWNRAWTDGYFPSRDGGYGRTDWKTLGALWSDHLILALPFFSSFLARNQLTFSRIVPDLPAAPVVFREVDSGLPFEPLINAAIEKYDETGEVESIVPVKSVYYARRSDFKAYMVKRCLGRKSSFDKPNIDHLSSDQFSFEDYLSLIRPPSIP